MLYSLSSPTQQKGACNVTPIHDIDVMPAIGSILGGSNMRRLLIQLF
ncbi:MAG: hypothetical protein ACP5I1_20540 [Candidatus Hinthialibacter sp.]